MPKDPAAAAAPGDANAANAARAAGQERTLLAAGEAGILVRVLSWSGVPIDDAIVTAQAASSSGEDLDRSEPTPVATMTTDASGAAAFGGLRTGRWTLVAAKDGFCRAGCPNVLLRHGVRSEPVVIHLGAGHTLEGVVSDANRLPIAGATVMAYPTSSALVRPRTTTDAQGRYRLDALAAGSAFVAAALPGGDLATVETIQIPEVGRLDLVLRTGGVLTGTVVDRDRGVPIAGAKVTASTSHTGSYRPSSASAVTDEHGRYAIRSLGEGLIHEVTATKAGYVQVPDLAAGRFDDMVPFRDGKTWTRDLAMSRGGRVTVSVHGPDGPVPGAKLSLRMPRNAASMVVTDEHGRAVFAAVLPGRVLVEARAAGLCQPEFPANWWALLNDPTAANRWLVEVAKDEATAVEIEMVRAAAIVGRVLGPGDQGLEGVAVKLANDFDPIGGDVTDTDGSFRIEGLQRGATAAIALTKDGYLAVGQAAAAVPANGDLNGLVLRMHAAPRVRGSVRSSGTPLGDAYVQVSLVPEREEHWQEEFRWANTGRGPIGLDGAFDAAIPGTSGRFAVRVVATRRTPTISAPVALVDGQESYRVDMELDISVALSGRVLALGTADGVGGARVRATWLAPGVDAARLVRGPEGPAVSAVSDGTGAFAIFGLAAGRYELRIAAEGFLTEVTEVRVPLSELAVSLSPDLSIEGHVLYPDGSPVRAAQIAPEPQAGNRSMSMSIDQFTVSGPDGRFKVPRLHPGQYRLRVHPPTTGVANFRARQSEVVAAGTQGVRIVVEMGATISGRISDAQGKGLADIGVAAGKPGEGNAASAETLADGAFALTGLEDGASYTLTVNPSWGARNAFASVQRPDVAAGTTGLHFVLEPGMAIAGVVVDGEGKPAAGLELTATSIDADDLGPVAWTDRDGRFEIRGLRPGKYRVATTQWFGRGVLVRGGDDVAAGTADVRLTATEGARLAGIVVDEDGAPIAGAEIAANAAARPRSGSWTRSQVDGTFALSGLLPGASYHVVVRLRGRLPAEQRGLIAGSTGLRFELPKGLEVQGRLVDAAQRPKGNATLRFVHTASGARTATRTDADGRFALSGLLPGTHSVEASTVADGAVVAQNCGTVEAGQRGVELKVR